MRSPLPSRNLRGEGEVDGRRLAVVPVAPMLNTPPVPVDRMTPFLVHNHGSRPIDHWRRGVNDRWRHINDRWRRGVHNLGNRSVHDRRRRIRCRGRLGGGAGGEGPRHIKTSSFIASRFPRYMGGSAGLLGQEKKDPGTEGVPGSPVTIGRGSLVRIVNHPLALLRFQS